MIIPITEAHRIKYKLLDAVTTTIVGDKASPDTGEYSIQAYVTGTGAVSASITIEFSDGDDIWIPAGTTPNISLSGTNSASDGFSVNANWLYVRATVTAISGTSAKVTVSVVV